MVEAFFIPALALIPLTLYLSGVRALQRFGMRISQVSLDVSNFSLKISHFFTLASLLRVLIAVLNWQRAGTPFQEMKDNVLDTDVKVQDRVKGKEWREERNFYICLFGLFLWIVTVRAEAVLLQFWDQIEREKSKPLEEKANVSVTEKVVNALNSAVRQHISPTPSATPASDANESPGEIEMQTLSTNEDDTGVRKRK